MNEIHLSGSPLRAIPPLAALLAFERAATQLSFRRAARDLSLSPSAISHQIRGLEQQFGIKLFVRGTRAVRLTPEGERYLAKVSAALATLIMLAMGAIVFAVRVATVHGKASQALDLPGRTHHYALEAQLKRAGSLFHRRQEHVSVWRSLRIVNDGDAVRFGSNFLQKR